MPEKMTAEYLEELLANGRLAKQLSFILEVEKLKTVLRRTLILDASRVENDAEHTWQLALMASVLAEHADEPVEIGRVLKMLLIHDIVEIDAGDTFAYDKEAIASQAERELRAAERIFNLLPSDQAGEFRALWDEFEAKVTAESRFANAMDRLQPLLHNYFTDGGTWRSAAVIADDVDRRMAPIAKASTELGNAAAVIIERAIDKGILAGRAEQAK
jgi:putative hydrolases of HD superfamily